MNGPDTHNAACGIETIDFASIVVLAGRPDTHNAACGIETPALVQCCRGDPYVPTHTMLRAALKQRRIEERRSTSVVPTHTMLRAALTTKWLCVSFRSHRAVFVCEKRTAILTMRRTDVRIEIQKGTA